ncbi:MAG: UvrD-helicase domain-containing protein [Lentisphaeria bacterium]|nr:UvrD-helicase domain-containing protein [Lentisphaeria bacterium]
MEEDPRNFQDLFEPDFPENRNLLPGNEAIMASAGTGKTFSLAMRYICLLHAGVPPGRILASTFTKKAAGEIYDKIVEELISLAVSGEKVKEFVKNFPLPGNTGFDTKRACGLLSRLLKSKDRLQISTLDSFFVNIIRAFPLECGIFGELSILEEADTRSRVNALLGLLKEIGQEDRREIMETVKVASFGENSKQLYGTVKELVFALYDRFLICPDAKFWCSEQLRQLVPAHYFSTKKQLEKIAETYPGLLDDFLAEYKINTDTQRLHNGFSSLLADALKAEDNPQVEENTGKLWEKISDSCPAFPAIEDQVSFLDLGYNRKRYLLKGEFYHATRTLMRHILYCNIRSLVRRNEALWRILDLFNSKYALLVRSSGNITFSDIPYLLKPAEENTSTGLALPFSDRAGIEERLDEKTDHYLIDEFQDTSDSQWNAISRLAEEAITDPDGGRSFFYVGDIKQSIYQWRYGNPGLFNMILDKFPESIYGERGIRKNTLIKSYRSNNEVLNMVNTVFMNPGGILNIPKATEQEKEILYSAMKKMQYEQHISAPSAAKQKGYSCYCQLPIVKKEEKKFAQEQKFRKIYDLLVELDPFNAACPFSVGVLFRTNRTASEFADCIRSFNMADISAGKKISLPVSLDSRLSVKESMYCVLACYILQGTAHPRDRFVKKMFEMLEIGRERTDQENVTKILGYETAEGLSGEDALYNGVRQQLANGGFELFFRSFAEAYREKLTPFDERRLFSLVEAARKYDLQGMDDIDTFLGLACEDAGNEISLRNTVQCMTYHKSKGLAFDIVIMPDLDGESMTKVNFHEGVFLNKDPEDFSPRFLTAFPQKQSLKSIPLLNDFARKLKDETAYENCCMLYVGMTRARHALYLFGNARGQSTQTINMASLCSGIFESMQLPVRPLSEDIQLIWESGDEKWYEEERKLFQQKQKENEQKKTEGLVKRNRTLTEKCLNKLITSCEKVSSSGKGLIYFPEEGKLSNAPKPSLHQVSRGKIDRTKSFSLSSTAADLGTKVHELFCKIDFYDGSSPEEYLQKIFGMDILKSEEGKLLAKAWTSSAIRDALKHPGTFSASLKKESSFLLPAPEAGNYISGIFDRLVAGYDEEGICISAAVIDYKSDREEEENVFLERYSRQLNIYRKAASSLLKIPLEKVECKILALRCGKVITVPMA